MSSIKYISNIELKKLLSDANKEEKLELTQLLHNDNESAIEEALDYAELHKLIISNNSYLKLLIDIANKLKINNIESYYSKVIKYDKVENLEYDYQKATKRGLKYAHYLEDKITIKLLGNIYENMSNKEKKLFNETLKTVAEQNGQTSNKNLVGAAGLLVLGNMGGFATYTLLTTMMSTLSFGVLGFGVYTAATSLLSVALGPVGWIGLGIYAAYKLGEPNYQKLIPIVVTIGMIRNRLDSENKEWDERYEKIKQEVKNNM
jgi:uncharacterized protein YaaW (UPF0174 family)